MASDKAPPDVEKALRALRCRGCGEPATTIHLMDPAADIDGLAIRVIDPNASLAPGYPQDDSSVAIAACELHDPGGYWFEIDRAVDEWEDWLRHLAEKVWRGDVALRKLVHPAG